MKYRDFFPNLVSESTVDSSLDLGTINYINTGLNNGIKVGWISRGGSGDRIRAANMRVAFKNKVHSWLVKMDEILFKKIKFNHIDVDILFSIVNFEIDNGFGQAQGLAYTEHGVIVLRSEFLSGKVEENERIRVLVHEWAHVWMEKQDYEVKSMIEKRYEFELQNKKTKVSDYGLTNSEEFWSFLVESYDKLDKELKSFVDYVVKRGKNR